MQLEEGYPNGNQRIAKRNASVGEGGRIDNDKLNALVSRPLYALDELMFGVALIALEAVTRISCERHEPRVNGLESHRPVVLGLALAKQVQVRAVEQEELGHNNGGREAQPVHFGAVGTSLPQHQNTFEIEDGR